MTTINTPAVYLADVTWWVRGGGVLGVNNSVLCHVTLLTRGRGTVPVIRAAEMAPCQGRFSTPRPLASAGSAASQALLNGWHSDSWLWYHRNNFWWLASDLQMFENGSEECAASGRPNCVIGNNRVLCKFVTESSWLPRKPWPLPASILDLSTHLSSTRTQTKPSCNRDLTTAANQSREVCWIPGTERCEASGLGSPS